MEKIYYIVENDNPVGPFTAEELREHGLSRESRIYVMGWPEFRNASDVPELKEVLEKVQQSPVVSQTQAVTGAATSSEPGEKELLMRILSHLDELQRENRQLRKEMDSMRGNVPPSVSPQADVASVTPPPSPTQVSETNVVMPPPFIPENTVSDVLEVPPAPPVKAFETENESTGTEIQTPVVSPPKKSGSSGCLIAFIILIAFSILLFVIIKVSSDSHKVSDYDSEEVTSYYDPYGYGEEVEVEAVEAETPAAEAPAAEWDYYDNAAEGN